jgi:hypothetical protein
MGISVHAFALLPAPPSPIRIIGQAELGEAQGQRRQVLASQLPPCAVKPAECTGMTVPFMHGGSCHAAALLADATLASADSRAA